MLPLLSIERDVFHLDIAAESFSIIMFAFIFMNFPYKGELLLVVSNLNPSMVSTLLKLTNLPLIVNFKLSLLSSLVHICHSTFDDTFAFNDKVPFSGLDKNGDPEKNSLGALHLSVQLNLVSVLK